MSQDAFNPITQGDPTFARWLAQWAADQGRAVGNALIKLDFTSIKSQEWADKFREADTKLYAANQKLVNMKEENEQLAARVIELTKTVTKLKLQLEKAKRKGMKAKKGGRR